MERMLLYEVSADKEHYTTQWLSAKEVDRHRAMGYDVRCSFCGKVDKLNIGDMTVMCAGDYGEVQACRNGGGNIVIVGFLNDDVTCTFPMNYCPKCGRRL